MERRGGALLRRTDEASCFGILACDLHKKVKTKRRRRRHNVARMKRSARRLAVRSIAEHSLSPTCNKQVIDSYLRRAETLAKCSCWMCGNRRKWNGLKIGEQRAIDTARIHDDWWPYVS